MQTRKDHVQAYQYATARLSSALIAGAATSVEIPLRRIRLGLVFGVFAGLLIAAGFTVFGLVVPGGATTWQQAGSIIVEKETGTRYLLVAGVLRPTANYASALLGAGASARGRTPTVRSVSRDSLGPTPHGSAIGIVGAPDVLPQPKDLVTDWAVCAGPGDAPAAVVLDPGDRDVTPLGDQRLVVADPSGATSVLWRSTVFPAPAASTRFALGLGDQVPVAVPDIWLAALPKGPVLEPAQLPDAGRSSRTIAGSAAPIGQVFTTSVGSGPQYFVLRGDGLAPITATEAALFASVPDAPAARSVPPSELSAVPVSADTSLTHRLPDLLGAPDATLGDGSVCARQAADGSPAGVAISRLGPATTRPAAIVPPGRGLYAVQTPLPTNGTPTRWLITEAGLRYRLTDDAPAALGLSAANPVPVPAAVLAAIPAGPTLDPARSLDPVRMVAPPADGSTP